MRVRSLMGGLYEFVIFYLWLRQGCGIFLVASTRYSFKNVHKMLYCAGTNLNDAKINLYSDRIMSKFLCGKFKKKCVMASKTNYSSYSSVLLVYYFIMFCIYPLLNFCCSSVSSTLTKTVQ